MGGVLSVSFPTSTGEYSVAITKQKGMEKNSRLSCVYIHRSRMGTAHFVPSQNRVVWMSRQREGPRLRQQKRREVSMALCSESVSQQVPV